MVLPGDVLGQSSSGSERPVGFRVTHAARLGCHVLKAAVQMGLLGGPRNRGVVYEDAPRPLGVVPQLT